MEVVEVIEVESAKPKKATVTRLRPTLPDDPNAGVSANAEPPHYVVGTFEAASPAAPEPSPPPPPAPIVVQRVGIPESFVAVFGALAWALSARLLLALALIGSFIVAVMAMRQQSIIGLLILAAYCLLTIAPLTALEMIGKQRTRRDESR